jgi:hypothetical protein
VWGELAVVEAIKMQKELKIYSSYTVFFKQNEAAYGQGP